VVSYDLSVRNSEGVIIQFVYGDDGMDPLKVESKETPFNMDRLLKYSRTYCPFDPIKE
jgi:DNA-directed RNA polymerase III subunit RPC1